jgi:hypothetical protein
LIAIAWFLKKFKTRDRYLYLKKEKKNLLFYIGNAPTELEIKPKIPNGDEGDRY